MQVYWIKQTSNQNSQKWPLNLAEVNLCFLRNRQRSDGRNTQNWLIEWNMHVIERHNEVHVGRLTWQTLHVSLYTICRKQYSCLACIRQLKFQIKYMYLSSICCLLNLQETCFSSWKHPCPFQGGLLKIPRVLRGEGDPEGASKAQCLTKIVVYTCTQGLGA